MYTKVLPYGCEVLRLHLTPPATNHVRIESLEAGTSWSAGCRRQGGASEGVHCSGKIRAWAGWYLIVKLVVERSFELREHNDLLRCHPLEEFPNRRHVAHEKPLRVWVLNLQLWQYEAKPYRVQMERSHDAHGVVASHAWSGVPGLGVEHPP
jgi:hypothetical protein